MNIGWGSLRVFGVLAAGFSILPRTAPEQTDARGKPGAS
jgi:hypothetical protein